MAKEIHRRASSGSPRQLTSPIRPHSIATPSGLRDGNTAQAEGIPIQCLALKRADNEGTGEALADPHRLGPVEIAAASGWNRPQPFKLLPIGLPELIPREAAGVVNSPQDDQRDVTAHCSRHHVRPSVTGSAAVQPSSWAF